MKIVIVFQIAVALATAFPKYENLNFRNIFVKPINDEAKLEPSPRIIGGNEAQPHSIPYQAFLEVLSVKEYWYCGGSLISANYVLTAGHCGANATEAYITLGAHKPMEIEDSQMNVLSKNITVHEDFYVGFKSIVYDVSVMKLPEPVTLSDYLQPAKLPSWADADKTYEGERGVVSGWGLLDGNDNTLSQVLMVVELSIISNRQCERDFGILLPSIICTSGMMNTGTCNGDSGGPLMSNGTQVGVVSFGAEGCFPGYPNGHSRITRFLAWIEANTDVKIADNNED